MLCHIQDKCRGNTVFTRQGTGNTPCIDVHFKNGTFDTCIIKVLTRADLKVFKSVSKAKN